MHTAVDTRLEVNIYILFYISINVFFLVNYNHQTQGQKFTGNEESQDN